jgi:hypothetical protein
VPTTTTLGKPIPSFMKTLFIKSQGRGKTKRKVAPATGLQAGNRANTGGNMQTGTS